MQNYIINSTTGQLKYVLTPGSANGPGLPKSNTDLRTYGAGNQNWGEGVNENFYRLLENFSCPESIINPGEPMDAIELNSVGAGINKPVNGQLWFNSTANKLFVYDAVNTVWKGLGGVTVSAIAPTHPAIGDTWYDLANQQLNVWEGAPNNWVPIGFTLQQLDSKYVNVTGDTMTGALTLSGAPTVDLHASTKKYVDDEITSLSSSLTGIIGTDFYNKTDSDNRYVNVTGDTLTGALVLSGAPTSNLHATTKQYVDSEITAASSANSSAITAISTNLATNYYTKPLSDARYMRSVANNNNTVTISGLLPSGGNSGDIWFVI